MDNQSRRNLLKTASALLVVFFLFFLVGKYPISVLRYLKKAQIADIFQNKIQRKNIKNSTDSNSNSSPTARV
jgi:hypothetical protein